MSQTVRYAKKKGFTLVELLVVISIIGMLAGLLLPALNAAREAGRRTQCVNNQRQLSLAVLNFHSVRGSIPGFVDSSNLSWIAVLLPFFEQNELWRRISQQSAKREDLIRISILFCPDSTVERIDGNFCYVANCGKQDYPYVFRCILKYKPPHQCPTPKCPYDHLLDWVPDTNLDNGVFYDNLASLNLFQTLDKISSGDGTSNTLLLSENLQTFPSDGKTKLGWINYDETNDLLGGAGMEDDVGFVYPDESTFEHVGSPDRRNCEWDDHVTASVPVRFNHCRDAKHREPWEQDGYFPCNQFVRPSSFHPGIVVCVFCDLHVQPLSHGIDEKLLENLMKAKSSTVISGDEIR